MLIEMGTRALIFLVLAACSNDEFTQADAGGDAEAGAQQETGAADAFEASAIEGGSETFCSQSKAFYCDDFETLTPATQSFSVTTPANPPAGTFDFGQGKVGKGLVVKASGALSSAYVTKQVQSDVLHGFTFAIQIQATQANAVYVRVQAQSSTFTLAADGLAQSLTVKGDSGTALAAYKADTNWHVFDVQLVNGSANVAVDGNSPVAIPFAAQSSMTSSIDLGIVSGALAGGSVSFDDVALR